MQTIIISAMDIVTKLMSALPHPVDTVTWLPRQQTKLFPNGTALSTYGSYTEISDAFIVVLKQYSWSNIGECLLIEKPSVHIGSYI